MNIVMMGDKSVGKTTLFIGTYAYLLQQTNLFDSDNNQIEEVIEIGNQSSMHEIGNQYSKLIKGKPLGSTGANYKAEYKIKPKAVARFLDVAKHPKLHEFFSNCDYDIVFRYIDRPGESFKKVIEGSSPETTESLKEDVSSAHRLVILIDKGNDMFDQIDVLRQVFDQILKDEKTGKLVKIDVPVCWVAAKNETNGMKASEFKEKMTSVGAAFLINYFKKPFSFAFIPLSVGHKDLGSDNLIFGPTGLDEFLIWLSTRTKKDK